MGAQEKQTDGIISIGTEATECNDSGDDAVLIGTAEASPSLVELPEPVLMVAALVICVGSVSALHLFVYLCFAHPDAANYLIPLLAVPIGQWMFKHATKYRVTERHDEAEEP